MSVELHFNHQVTSAAPGSALFDCADALGVRVPTSCRGQGKCKECLVEVVEGMDLLSPRTSPEQHLQGNFRLACSCRIIAESGLVRCHTLRRGQMRVERQAFQLPARQAGRLPDPAITRTGSQVLCEGKEIDRSDGPLHGLALDLGTTTIVLRLLNLETGEVVADASFENPQRFGGSDVMARIRYDSEDGTRLLQRTLAAYLSHAIDEFPVRRESIYEVVVAGNTTMRDLFFRLDVHPIGQSPYQSVSEMEFAAGKRPSTSLEQEARRLGLGIHPRARVYGLPVISGHVGADAAACMLAIDLAHEDRLVALMDIGTNTELVLGNRHKVYAASCPAGPAFEGGRITCGMPGMPGAIERVSIQPDGRFVVQVIDGEPMQGICGSGLVDALGELVRTEKINPLGRLESGEDRVVFGDEGEGPIYLTEADINELAQAKGANAAGLQVIHDSYGVRFEDIDVFYLAGGFGRYLDLEASRRIGLIPDLPASKIRQIGNAAIEGASIALLSLSRRRGLEQLVQRATHCRLETHPGFFDFFVEGCQLRPIRSST